MVVAIILSPSPGFGKGLNHMPRHTLPRVSGVTTLLLSTLSWAALGSTPVAPTALGSNAAALLTSGPLAGYRVIETRGNTFTKNLQARTAVAADAKGNLLTVWASRRQEAGTYGVFAQLLDPLGRPLGTEIHVNQFVAGAQNEPAVAYAADGTAVIVWQSLGQDGSGGGIYMRRFSSRDGVLQPLGDETLVNATTVGDQMRPSVACNARGETLVAWASTRAGSVPQVAARLYAADGSADDELLLSSVGAGHGDRLPAITALPNGSFVVSWAHTNAADHPAAIEARVLTPQAGAAAPTLSASLLISDPADPREQIEPTIGSDSQGRLICAWMRQRAAGTAGYGVVARRLNADGTPLSDIFVVSERSDGWLSGAAVAVASDGRFAISYNLFGEKVRALHAERPTTPATLFARLYDANGSPTGGEFQVNRDTEGKHALAVACNATRMIWSSRDQLAVAWDGHANGDQSAAALTLFAPADLQTPTPPVVEALAAASEIKPTDLRTAPDFNPDWEPQAMAMDLDAAGPDYGFMAFQTTAWQPPDPDCAAGPNHIVSVVNMDIRIHTKDGTLVFNQKLETFFAGTGAGDFVFDPVAVYDPHADRFVIATADHQGSADGLNIAVSASSDPTEGWHKYHFNTDAIGDYIDFENLGVGPDAYYIAADYFGNYRNVIHIFDKTPMLSGQPFSIRSVRTANTLLSLGAVKCYDSNPPAQYFATAWSSSTSIRVYALQNPLGSPTLTSYAISVPYHTAPPDATQKGTSHRVSTIDDRIKNGVYRDGSLWLTHTVSEDNTARVRWYEIDLRGWPTSGNNPVLAQNASLDYGSGEHNWFPDITVSNDGDAVITCSRSSVNDYPYVARAGRKSYDADDTFRASVRLKESDGPTTSDRWGDYSGNDEDPVDPGVVWSHTIYNTTSNNWRTWVGRIDTDQLMVLNDPGTLQRGTTETITVDGAQPGGTVYAVYSLSGPGNTFVPELNATLDLAHPVLAGSATAAADGSVTFSTFIPGAAPAGPVYLQFIELNNTSNMLTATLN
jgi:hypothetical protein